MVVSTDNDCIDFLLSTLLHPTGLLLYLRKKVPLSKTLANRERLVFDSALPCRVAQTTGDVCQRIQQSKMIKWCITC